MLDVKIKLFDGGATPSKGSIGAACYDGYAREEVIIPAGKIKIVPLGFAIELPFGYEMQVRPRSGLAAKSSIVTILGTVDCDYRGEVGAIVANMSDSDYTVNAADRIAQLAIRKVGDADVWGVNIVSYLTETERGKGGFGHTGK